MSLSNHSKLKPILDMDSEVVGYRFYCPGCKTLHAFYTVPMPWAEGAWGFNDDHQAPTFSPSLFAFSPDGDKCHLFLINGVLKYCGDTFHHLRASEVPLPDIPDDLR